MIKYPNMMKTSKKAITTRAKTFGNRGQSFEDEINEANKSYLNQNRTLNITNTR